jgi:hypothetical protein
MTRRYMGFEIYQVLDEVHIAIVAYGRGMSRREVVGHR